MTYLELLNNKNLEDIELLFKLQGFDKEHPIEELIDLVVELNPQTCGDKDICPGFNNFDICDSTTCYKNDDIDNLDKKIEELEELLDELKNSEIPGVKEFIEDNK